MYEIQKDPLWRNGTPHTNSLRVTANSYCWRSVVLDSRKEGKSCMAACAELLFGGDEFYIKTQQILLPDLGLPQDH